VSSVKIVLIYLYSQLSKHTKQYSGILVKNLTGIFTVAIFILSFGSRCEIYQWFKNL